MLVLFIVLVSASFINNESSIYLKQSPMGRVLTRGSIREGQGEDGWMNSVLGHFFALSRLNWAGDNLG